MGNDKSKLGSSSSHSHYQDRTHTDPRVDRAFKRLAGSSDTLCYKKLLDNFSKDLSEKLWAFLSENRSTDVALTFKDFSQHASELMGNSTDIYIVVCKSVHSLLKICSEAAGVSAVKGDEPFISNVVQGMILGGHSLQHIIAWKNTVCPKFCHALQCLVLHKLLEYDFPSVDYSSDILSPLQMWYIHCSLPSVYFPADNCKWTPLYTSTTQGISINRFEMTVFDYRGPTVSVFHLTDLRIIVLATDQEWRHGSNRFGGSSTIYFEVYPSLVKLEEPSSIYCNFKIRSAAFGLSFKDVMKIDKDMGNVKAIEVWGCAGANTLLNQQNLKIWQNRQAEKNKKVPLPGNWDENPDKTLMEMAGFQFSNERKLMETESMHRSS